MVVAQARGFAPSANLALRADVFRAIGGFDERFCAAAAEDRDLCARGAEAGHRVVRAPDAVVRHHRALSAAAFVRQHATYGRGAVTYARFRRRRARTLGLSPPALLPALAAAGVRHAQLGRVLLSQVAYACGAAAELARPRGSVTSRTTRNPRAS